MIRFVLSSAVAVALVASTAVAQSAAPQTLPIDSSVAVARNAPADSAVATPVAAAVKPAPLLSVNRLANNPPKPIPLAPHPHDAGSKMMIFGGAAILVGAVVGGDAGGIIMVGGACVGLYGLWVYLN